MSWPVRVMVGALLAVLFGVGAVAPALAHTRIPSNEPPPNLRMVVTHSAGTPANVVRATPATVRLGRQPSPVPFHLSWVLTLAFAPLAATITRPRRCIGFLLVILLIVFAFQVGLHSAHHFNDGREQSCVFATSLSRLSGIAVDQVECQAPKVSVDPAPAIAVDFASATRPLSPDQGRAPPPAA